jgi:hypothetical protein
MKKTLKLAGIIVIMAIIEFSMTACGEEEEWTIPKTSGRLTITGLNDYEGNWIRGGAMQLDTGGYIWILDSSATGKETIDYPASNLHIKIPSSGSVTFHVWQGKYNLSNFTGSPQNVEFITTILDQIVAGGNIYINGKVAVNFVNGIASGEFVPD